MGLPSGQQPQHAAGVLACPRQRREYSLQGYRQLWGGGRGGRRQGRGRGGCRLVLHVADDVGALVQDLVQLGLDVMDGVLQSGESYFWVHTNEDAW